MSIQGLTKCSCGCGLDITDGLRWILESIDRNMGLYYPNYNLTLNSGARCAKYNASIGGASDSAHIKGIAADIRNQSGTPIEYTLLIIGATQAGINRFGISDSLSYIHIDIDSSHNKAIWDYSKITGRVLTTIIKKQNNI